MKRHWVLLMPLLLAGCFEDKEAILSECRLKYDQDGTGQEGVMLCMSAKGYEFASGWIDNNFTEINGKCWNGTFAGKTAVPTKPAYILSDCYSKRSLWNIFSH